MILWDLNMSGLLDTYLRLSGVPITMTQMDHGLNHLERWHNRLKCGVRKPKRTNINSYQQHPDCPKMALRSIKKIVKLKNLINLQIIVCTCLVWVHTLTFWQLRLLTFSCINLTCMNKNVSLIQYTSCNISVN